MPTVTLFGIANCDTVRKARRWLEQHKVTYCFHDFRKDGLEPAQIKSWLAGIGWETLLNKRGRTWRELSDREKQVNNAKQAIDLCHTYPTLIKRPILVAGKQILIGFEPGSYARLFAND